MVGAAAVIPHLMQRGQGAIALVGSVAGYGGLPKASVMSHNRWLANFSGIGGLGVRLHHNDTMYVALPLYHNNALSVSLGSVLAWASTASIAGARRTASSACRSWPAR